MQLAEPVTIGGYQCSQTPDEPIVLHLVRTPCAPGKPRKEQHRLGRADLLATSFETFEREIRPSWAACSAGGGFDPARDIAGITVNRWPHGYTYNYNTLTDPVEWSCPRRTTARACVGAPPFGRITIANADAAGSSHTDAAIEQAYRAVREVVELARQRVRRAIHQRVIAAAARPGVLARRLMVGEMREAVMNWRRTATIVTTLLLLTISGSAAAQTAGGTGVISGTVTDNTKAMLPGVTVTVSGSAAMGTPSAVTRENGTFRVPSLPPGEYTVQFELTGFGTVIREGIRVGVGFTATVNVDLNVAGVSESVTVSGQSPVVDVTNTTVATRYDTELLASLPGARDYWAVLAQTPAVSMGRVDVGGSGALTQQPYTAYGLTSAGGVNRAEVEGIMVNEGAGGGGSDMYYTDYGAFAEIAINAVGNGAEMPNPGVLSQLIAKSGGNQYHGNVYFDYQNESMEATNIDDAQIAAGVIGSDVVDPRDTNRLEMFRDFNADLGGFVRRDRLWWYGAIRRTDTGQRYPTLLDDIQDTWVPVGTGKATWNVAQNHKLSGFYQYQTKEQPDYLGAIRIAGGRQSPALMTRTRSGTRRSRCTSGRRSTARVLGSALLFEARAGAYHSVWAREGKSTRRGSRTSATTSSRAACGPPTCAGIGRRAMRSLAYAKQGWGGNHNFKLGAEVMRDLLVQPFAGFPGASQALSVRNNNVATQVDIYLPGSESKNGLWTYSLFLNDSWQAGRRLTVNAGLRFDRHSAYLPDQFGPAGQTFSRVDGIVTFNNWGPRLSASFDLTGDAKTLAKASWGRFWLYPGADLASGLNPNATMWFERYGWTDGNGNGVFDQGEQGALQLVQGGRAATTFDENLENTYVISSPPTSSAR